MMTCRDTCTIADAKEASKPNGFDAFLIAKRPFWLLYTYTTVTKDILLRKA